MLDLLADAAEEDHVYAFNDEVAARENAEEAGKDQRMNEGVDTRANNEDRNDQTQRKQTSADEFSRRKRVDDADDAAEDQPARRDIQKDCCCCKAEIRSEEHEAARENGDDRKEEVDSVTLVNKAFNKEYDTGHEHQDHIKIHETEGGCDRSCQTYCAGEDHKYA